MLEALACDVPVLATPVGIAPEVLAGLPGTLCQPFDAAAWRAALAPHLSDPDPRIDGRAAGRAVLVGPYGRPGAGGVAGARRLAGETPARTRPGGSRATPSDRPPRARRPSGRPRGRGQLLHRDRHAPAERSERVAALQHRSDRYAELSRPRRAAAPPSSAKPASVTSQSASGSSEWASKPAEINSSWGANSRARGTATSRTSDTYSASPAPGATGRLTVKPAAGPGADVAGRPGARIQRRLVDRQEEHLRVGVEDVVGAVAVVHVPVDDHHPLAAAHVDRMARGDGDVVEQAEAHRAAGLGVVAGRAVGAEAGRRCAVEEPVDEGHRASGGVTAPPRTSPRETTVSASIWPPPPSAMPLHQLDVALGVHGEQRLPRGGRRERPLVAQPAPSLELFERSPGSARAARGGGRSREPATRDAPGTRARAPSRG